MKRLARSATALGAAVAMLGSGCARLVTKDPETVARLNDGGWRIRQRPVPQPPPAVEAPVSESSVAAPAALVAPAPTPVTPLPPAPVTPPLFRDKPEVAQALRTPVDSLGIPAGLYAVDPLLSVYRTEMDAQASARRGVGTGTLVFSLICGGISAWAFSVGSSRTSSPDPQVRSSASQAVAYGGLGMAFSLGGIITGFALMGTPSNRAPLQSYYRETYGAAR